MNTISRVLIICFLLITSIACYGHGLHAGGTFFVFLGVVFEGLFWAGILGVDKKSKSHQ